MRTVLLACLLAVLFRLAGRHIWRWWVYDGYTLPADLVRRSQ